MTRRTYLLAALLSSYALCVACAPAAKQGDNHYVRLYRGQDVREVVHPNGLFLHLPASLSVTETTDGFTVAPPPVRSSGPVVIRLRPNEERPVAPGPERRAVGARELSYRIAKVGEGGSGGAEYALAAWEACPGGHISYHQVEQAETGEPFYEFAWYVIGQAGFRRRK